MVCQCFVVYKKYKHNVTYARTWGTLQNKRLQQTARIVLTRRKWWKDVCEGSQSPEHQSRWLFSMAVEIVKVTKITSQWLCTPSHQIARRRQYNINSSTSHLPFFQSVLLEQLSPASPWWIYICLLKWLNFTQHTKHRWPTCSILSLATLSTLSLNLILLTLCSFQDVSWLLVVCVRTATRCSSSHEEENTCWLDVCLNQLFLPTPTPTPHPSSSPLELLSYTTVFG